MELRDVKDRLEELHPASFAWAITCCHGDGAEAEDVLQTAYLKVLDRRARFAGRSSFKTWFFAVIRRTARERWRRRSLRQTLLLERSRREPAAGPATDPHVDAAHAERAKRIHDALAGLSERQRMVLELVFYQDLTVAEAAEVLATSVGSARVHYARGKKKLLAAIGPGTAMTDGERERRLLRGALADGHRSTGEGTPPFARLWSRAAARVEPARHARRRRAAFAAASLALVLSATIAWWAAERQGPDELERALALAATAGEWQAPLDFLLETPGHEWLEDAPRWEPRPDLDIWLPAPDRIESDTSGGS